jgi:hypothetical protein
VNINQQVLPCWKRKLQTFMAILNCVLSNNYEHDALKKGKNNFMTGVLLYILYPNLFLTS